MNRDLVASVETLARAVSKRISVRDEPIDHRAEILQLAEGLRILAGQVLTIPPEVRQANEGLEREWLSDEIVRSIEQRSKTGSGYDGTFPLTGTTVHAMAAEILARRGLT